MNEPSIAHPKAPGVILKRELDVRGWTQKDLAEIVSRPAQVIMRIASLVPSATEMLCALGLRDSLVAVTHECDYPRGRRAAAAPHAQRDPRGAQHRRDRPCGA